MASTSFTPNLGLCAWNALDKPKRIDFVNDNNKIDTQLGSHIFDKTIHVTQEEKECMLNAYTVSGYVGDGAQSREIMLDEQYRFVIVFQKYYPLSQTDSNGNTIMRCAIVGREFGSNSDLVLKSDRIVVKQDSTATDSVINNFNEQSGQYVMIKFR